MVVRTTGEDMLGFLTGFLGSWVLNRVLNGILDRDIRVSRGATGPVMGYSRSGAFFRPIMGLEFSEGMREVPWDANKVFLGVQIMGLKTAQYHKGNLWVWANVVLCRKEGN